MATHERKSENPLGFDSTKAEWNLVTRGGIANMLRMFLARAEALAAFRGKPATGGFSDRENPLGFDSIKVEWNLVTRGGIEPPLPA